MNISAPDAPQPGAPSEGAVVRFLGWLIQPPDKSQPREMLVLRWLFRAVAFLLCAFVASEVDLSLDNTSSSGSGMGDGGRKNPIPGKPPA